MPFSSTAISATTATGQAVVATVLFALLLVAFRQRGKGGYAAFQPLAAGTQILAGLMLATAPPLSASSSSSPVEFILAPSGLLVALLLYLREDIPFTRNFIGGVAGSTVVLALIADHFAPLALRLPFDLRRTLAFAISYVVASLFLIVLHEFAFFKLNRIPLGLRIVMTASVAILVQGVILAAIGHAQQVPIRASLAPMATWMLAGTFVQSVPLWAYLRFIEPSSIDSDSNRTTRMLDVFSIVTYRERYQVAKQQLAEAEAASRAKSRFLAHMSHELRTPLNAIIGFTQVMIDDDEVTADESALYLERVRANGRDLLKLIDGLLDLSKVESGRTTMEVVRIDIGELVGEVVEQLRGAAQGKDLELAIAESRAGATIRADRRLLKQVLINLIGNAIKFTHAGRITTSVVVGPRRRPIRIDVQDTGIGVAPEKQAIIFEAFEQADQGTDRKHGGTGLGLAISRAFCQQMGFELTVDSQPGVGSTFSILFEPPSEKGGQFT